MSYADSTANLRLIADEPLGSFRAIAAAGHQEGPGGHHPQGPTLVHYSLRDGEIRYLRDREAA